MPRKPKPSTPDASLAPIPSEILDQFVGQGPLTPEELALGGELTHHLGYAVRGATPEDTTNHRNGSSGKTVLKRGGIFHMTTPRSN